ncbi:unnamed protein product [Orchesella dallaii]|uniref:Uncharacterized protein n=1 Tax=Orchesella dallaii TaxID=48710 RepID=A0ABP1RBU0_9HEXA
MMTSLDDYIKQKRGGGGGRSFDRCNKNDKQFGTNTLPTRSSEGCRSGRSVVVLSSGSGRDYGDDVMKSLDEVVTKRGILRPAKSTWSYERERDGELGHVSSSSGGGGRKVRGWDDDDSGCGKKVERSKITWEGDTCAEEDCLRRKRRWQNDNDIRIEEGGRREKKRWEEDICSEEGDRRKMSSWDDNIGSGEGDVTDNNVLEDDPKLEPPANTKKQDHWPPGLTPFQAVSYLVEKGMIIKLKIGRLLMDDEEAIKRNLNNLWRCIVTCGDVEGMADSCRKVVAKEMAAHEFLRKLREEYPDAEVPSYEPPSEFFIHPKICKWVEDLGVELGLKLEFGMPVKMPCPKGKLNGAPYMYVTTCQIGDRVLQGTSTDEKYCTIDAYRKVWEFFTGEKFPYTRHFMGRRCNPLLKYDFATWEMESEYYNKRIEDTEFIVPVSTDTNLDVNQQFALNEVEVESDADDDDTFPVDSFSSALKKNRDLKEKLNQAKRAEERKKMIMKN